MEKVSHLSYLRKTLFKSSFTCSSSSVTSSLDTREISSTILCCMALQVRFNSYEECIVHAHFDKQPAINRFCWVLSQPNISCSWETLRQVYLCMIKCHPKAHLIKHALQETMAQNFESLFRIQHPDSSLTLSTSENKYLYFSHLP